VRTHHPAYNLFRVLGDKTPITLLIKTFKFMKKSDITSFLLNRKGKKLLFIMNLAVLILLVGFIQASANDYYTTNNNNRATADQQQVTGKITDDKGEAIPGATVIEKGTSNGTVSDMDGNYSIALQGDAPTLVISFVGMITQEIVVGNQSQINVSMQADFIGIEEVVAIGYGTMKKSDLTGSVTNVSAEELVDRPVVNVGQALQNKVSGVQVIKQAAGEPGSRPQIRIRGTNSMNSNSEPLFVVDGIVGVKNALYNLNPNDILSMDVLKDASATAIYGTRGANGVIIITTKRGKAGDTKVNYNGSASIGIMTRHNYTVTTDQFMYQYEQAFTNTPKYGTLKTEKDFRGGQGYPTSWSELPHLFEQVPQGGYFMDLMGNDGNYYKPRFYSDWEEEAFSPAFGHNHHIDVSGGTEKIRLSLSLGHVDQDGLLIDSWYKRTNAKMTADIEIAQWLDLSANMSYARSDRSLGDDQTRTISETWPLLPTKYPEEEVYGKYAGKWSTGRDFNVGENWRNIVFTMAERDGNRIENQLVGGVILNAQITPDLSFKTDFSVDIRNNEDKWFNGTMQGTRTNDARRTARSWTYWQNQNYFNYNKTIDDHNIAAMLGLSWSEDVYDDFEARAYAFASDFYKWNNLAAGTNEPRVYSGNARTALNSYFARLNYSYKNRYMITATGRIDGSSKFGENNKYAFFPSIGGAWRISEEGFMADSEIVSNLKLRASAGQTGNQEIGSYVTQQYIANAIVVMGDGTQAGLYPGSTGNPDLKWETTTQYDIGFDLGLFENRVGIVFDVYYKKTDDMLFNLPLPTSTTSGNAWVNYGSVENKGIEFDLITRNIETNNFTWSTTFTITSNQNEITELGPTNADVYADTGAGNATSVYRVGEPIGSFFGLNRMGVWRTDEAVEAARYGRLPGDLKFEDVNQDGKIELITDGDVIGRAYPKFYGGLNNTFKWKNFDAAIDVQFVGGVNKAIVHESAEDRQFVSGMVNSTLNAWRPDHQGPEVMVAQIRAGNAGARYDSYSDTHQMYNGAFIRGNVASLGYTFSNIGVERLRVYFSMENFFLITGEKLEGYDPEGSSQGKIRSNVPNIDKYQYPNPTNFSLGVNVSF